MHSLKFVIAFVVVVAVSCQHEDETHYEPSVYPVESGFDSFLPADSSKLYRAKRQNIISVGAEHTRQQGTNVNVEAQRRLWTSNDRRSQLDANANYNRQFGGHGHRQQDYGAGVRFQHRF